MDHSEIERIAVEAVSRLHRDKNVRLGKQTWRWRLHAASAKMLHWVGIHDYMPTMVYDVDNDTIEQSQAMCWICRREG